MPFATLRKRTRTSIVIAASPTEVWDALTDLPGYARWNPALSLHPWRDDRLVVGRRAWLRLRMYRFPMVVPVLVQTVDPERELAWVGGPWGLMRGRHYFELHELGDKTELVHGEEFAGLLLPLLWPTMEDQLDRLYRSINDALAAHVERS